MNIVLTMAGKYSRFKLFGSKVPKYLLPLGSETMLAEVIKQFKCSAKKCNIYLVANRNDQLFFPIVRSIMRKYEIDEGALIYIDDTSSQLETALNVSVLLPFDQMDCPVAFANIDTILYARESFFNSLKNCAMDNGILDTFPGENNQYSYARVDGEYRVLNVADKNMISSKACSGLYGFGSYAEMSRVSEGLLREDGGANFTDLYNCYISKDKKVYAHFEGMRNNTIVLGTPEEYVINIHRFK